MASVAVVELDLLTVLVAAVATLVVALAEQAAVVVEVHQVVVAHL